MANIIDGFSTGMPSQSRVRVQVTHDLDTCDVWFDFDLDSYQYSFYYTTDGSLPTEDSEITFPYATKKIAYGTQVKTLIVNEGTQEKTYPAPVWTPPQTFINFKFPLPGTDYPERPNCSVGNEDLRRTEGPMFTHTEPVSRTHGVAIVWVEPSRTICEDVGLFFSLDGTDPDPGEPGSGGPIPGCVDLSNCLVNYEVLTSPLNTPVRIVSRTKNTQGDSGGCAEDHCVDSVDGSEWTKSC